MKKASIAFWTLSTVLTTTAVVGWVAFAPRDKNSWLSSCVSELQRMGLNLPKDPNESGPVVAQLQEFDERVTAALQSVFHPQAPKFSIQYKSWAKQHPPSNPSPAIAARRDFLISLQSVLPQAAFTRTKALNQHVLAAT